MNRNSVSRQHAEEFTTDEAENLSHMRRQRKYHVAFMPECWRKMLHQHRSASFREHSWIPYEALSGLWPMNISFAR